MSFIEVVESAESILKILQPENSTEDQIIDLSRKSRSSLNNMIQLTEKGE